MDSERQLQYLRASCQSESEADERTSERTKVQTHVCTGKGGEFATTCSRRVSAAGGQLLAAMMKNIHPLQQPDYTTPIFLKLIYCIPPLNRILLHPVDRHQCCSNSNNMSKLPIFHSNEIFTNPVRLLVKESHAIFSTIPRMDTELNRANRISISRRYRSILHECVENLSRDLATDHSKQIRIFKELEVIWNLCEILLLDVSQTGTLVMQLRNWVKMHFDVLSQEARDILRSLDAGNYQLKEDCISDVYWDLLTKLILRGDTNKAIQLLSCHHEFRINDQMQLIASMLETMPLSNQYIVHEFYNKWLNWSAWCKRERDTGQFKSNKHLLNIVRLLSQDTSVYEELAPSCETWYQLMITYLLYSDPCIRETDLSDLCRRMITTFREKHPKYANQTTFDDDPYDEIIISAFEYELISVIANCCAYFDDNWWFVTHFVDLLHCSDQLSIHDISEADRLRETFLQDYASTLFDDELLWPIGVSYLDKCPTSGMFFLEIILSRIPLSINDEVKANKVISIAKRRNLLNVSKSVSVLMARGWLSKTTRLNDENIKTDRQHKRSTDKGLPQPVNLSNALYWAIRSGDTALITYISDQYLYYYCKTGTFPDNSVFESLRRLPLDNERLAFLAKYFEFKQILQESNEDLTDAGTLIRALLASEIYPKFFRHELLEDAKRLLDVGPQLIFHPDSTLDLMRSVDEITKEGTIEEDVELRKNLVRNMTKALITLDGSDD